MVQRRSGLRLALESSERYSVMRHALRQKLQRHLTLQLCVLGAIHHPHPAAAKLFNNAVMGDRFTDEGFGFLHLAIMLVTLGMQSQP